MEKYTIYPLHVCTFLMQVSAGKDFPEVPIKEIESPVLAYLIKGENTAVVVDTGACEPEWSAKYHHPMYYPAEMRIENRLAVLGVDVKDVKIVVNTHLHWDHCYNNHLFPNADIFVQVKELEAAINPPCPEHYLYYESFQMGLTPPWLSTAGQFKVVDGDYELLEGIKLLFTPGHTPGFQCVQVQTSGGRYVIGSDCVPNLEGWNNRKLGLPVASAINTNYEVFYKSLKRLMAETDHMLPGHDFAVLDHPYYPYEG